MLVTNGGPECTEDGTIFSKGWEVHQTPLVYPLPKLLGDLRIKQKCQMKKLPSYVDGQIKALTGDIQH